MNAYVFPGQGSQKPGMGLDLYTNSQMAHELFEKANEILYVLEETNFFKDYEIENFTNNFKNFQSFIVFKNSSKLSKAQLLHSLTL